MSHIMGIWAASAVAASVAIRILLYHYSPPISRT